MNKQMFVGSKFRLDEGQDVPFRSKINEKNSENIIQINVNNNIKDNMARKNADREPFKLRPHTTNLAYSPYFATIGSLTTNPIFRYMKPEFQTTRADINKATTSQFSVTESYHNVQQKVRNKIFNLQYTPSTSKTSNSEQIEQTNLQDDFLKIVSPNDKINECICERPNTTIFCIGCEEFFYGRIKIVCPRHLNVNFLMDIDMCSNTQCKAPAYMMVEVDIDYQNIKKLKEIRDQADTEIKKVLEDFHNRHNAFSK